MRCKRCGSARRAPELARWLSRSAIVVAGGLASALGSAASPQAIETLVSRVDTLDSRADSLGTTTLLVVPTVNGAQREVALLVRDGEGRYYADDAALVDWRVAPPYPASVQIAGRSLRPLGDIRGLALRIQERSMTAEVVVPPDLMVSSRRSLA